MIRIAIIIVLAIVGAGAGFFIKQMTAAPVAMAEDGEAHEGDGAESDDKKTKGDAKKKDGGKKKGKDSEKDGEGTSNYLRFSRQFVIPVFEDGSPAYLMVLEILVDMDGSFSEGMYAYEPKLRDAFLSDLYRFANEGVLTRITTNAETMNTVKDSLLSTTNNVLGEGAKQILIIDIGIQEY